MKRLWPAAAIAAGVLLAGVPATSGAWTAGMQDSATAATTSPYFTCAGAYGADAANAYFQWPMNEASGATSASDVSGRGDTGLYLGSMTATSGDPIACPSDTGTGYTLNGSTSQLQDGTAAYAAPNTFSEEVWFKTSVKQGWLIGFGDKVNTSSSRAASTYRDRVLYIDKNGNVVFAVYPNNAVTTLATTSGAYADGGWHYAVATMGSGGAVLWVDGAQVASNTSVTSSIAYNGDWRIGYDSLSGAPNAAASSWFSGQLRWAAAYRTVLSSASIAQHWRAGVPGTHRW